MTDIQKQNIENLRRQGLSYSRIADALEMSINTVKSHCQRHGLSVGNASAIKNEEPQNVCKQCGKVLEQAPRTRKRTYCSDKCRYAWWNANLIQRRSANHSVCANCGMVFGSYRSKNRKYCGHPCYIDSRFKKGGTAGEQGTV